MVDREDYADGNEYERIHNALSDAVERRRNERKLADVIDGMIKTAIETAETIEV